MYQWSHVQRYIMMFRVDISLFARTKEWAILNLKMLWVSVNIDRGG